MVSDSGPAAPAASEPLPGGLAVLEMRGITKQFQGVRALAGVDFRMLPGEVHALMGQNGAGQHLHQGGLAGAVLAHQRVDLAG